MKQLWLFGLLLSVFISGVAPPLLAQNGTYTLSGVVRDADDKEGMAYVNIFVEETGQGTITNEKGHYSIDGLHEGKYTIRCSHLSCDHLIQQVDIEGPTERDFELEHQSVELDNIVVQRKAIRLQSVAVTNELSGMQLSALQGQSLAQSLESIVGVNSLSTGNSISKPSIQGLHSNRILILNNGVRQEGQQWGVEHAPEIDPFIAEKMSVIKGAGSVRYGAEALGGVILIEPKALPEEKGINGGLSLHGSSNGRQGTVSAMLEGLLSEKLPISGRIMGTLKRGGNIKAPNYHLDNTGVEEYNFSYALAYKKPTYGAELFYSQFNTNLGIFSGSHIGNLTDLKNAIDSGEPIIKSDFSYQLKAPKQHIEHELFKASSYLATGRVGQLKVQYARQYNLRQEFDAHSTSGGTDEEADIQFRTTTHTADLIWEHKPIRFLRGSVGMQFLKQQTKVAGGGLVPSNNSVSGGIFLIERWRNYPFPLELEAGIRYDFRRLEVSGLSADADSQFDYNSFSGNLGAIYRMAEGWQIRFNTGSAWRAPNINELFSDGVHHGAASYEKGRADLKVEKAFNNSLSLQYQTEAVQAELMVYHNRISNYIYLQADAEPVLTIRGAFPAYSYQQADAHISGLDFQLSHSWKTGWQWQSQLSLIYGHNRSINDHLNLMPSNRMKHSLKYTFSKEKKEQSPFVGLNVQTVFQQHRIPEEGDFAPAPATYHLLGFEIGTTFKIGRQSFEAGLVISNLLNTEYRNYLNRFRYFADEIGRNFSFRLKIPIQS